MGVACNRNEEPFFNLQGAAVYDLSPADTTIIIKVKSNVGCTLHSDAFWCVPKLTKEADSYTLEVSVAANDTQDERSAILTVSSDNEAHVEQIMVRQQFLVPDATTRYRLPVVFHVLYKSSTNKQQNIVKGHLATLIEEVNQL